MQSNNHIMSCCELQRFMKSNGHGNCKYKSASSQFAAIDSHIDFMELPKLGYSEPYSIYTKCTACINPDFSLEATLISILGTYKTVTSIVIFIEKKHNIEDLLKCIKSNYMHIFIITPSQIHKSKFCIYSITTDQYITTIESDMIKLIKTFIYDTTLVMYLYSDSVYYAPQFQYNGNSIWITTYNTMLCMTGTKGSRLMAMFYVEPSVNNMVRINIGSAYTDIDNNIGLEQKLYSLTRTTLNAVAANGMCYFCAYLHKCHEVLCANHKDKEKVVVELSEDFRPNANSI